MTVRVDDLVAPKQETAAQSSAELTAHVCVCVKGGETRGREKKRTTLETRRNSRVSTD